MIAAAAADNKIFATSLNPRYTTLIRFRFFEMVFPWYGIVVTIVIVPLLLSYSVSVKGVFSLAPPYCGFITVPSDNDDDGDGILSISDEILSFSF